MEKGAEATMHIPSPPNFGWLIALIVLIVAIFALFGAFPVSTKVVVFLIGALAFARLV